MLSRPVNRGGDRGYSLIEIMLVVGLIGVISAVAVPMMNNTLGNFRLSGDARGLTNAISLTRMQAASNFTKTRLYVDSSLKSYHTEICQKAGLTCTWVSQGGDKFLSSSTQESYSFGAVTTPPLNTQAAIGQAPPCLNAAGNPIGNTYCIVFNSRGIPINSTDSPYGDNALYLTDGTAVYGVTVSITSAIRLWRTNPTATPSWVQQ
jgi:prepilin-type N-terminal cleavage/methylation domain-containing protein